MKSVFFCNILKGTRDSGICSNFMARIEVLYATGGAENSHLSSDHGFFSESGLSDYLS